MCCALVLVVVLASPVVCVETMCHGAIGIELRARAAYAGLSAQAVATTGEGDLTLQMVVANLPRQEIKATRR